MPSPQGEFAGSHSGTWATMGGSWGARLSGQALVLLNTCVLAEHGGDGTMESSDVV